MTEKETGGIQLDTKSIILIAAIVLIVAVASILIVSFHKKKKQWIIDEEKNKARELRLQGISGVFAGRRYELKGQVSIGRAPNNNIVFPTDTAGVGGAHCVIMANNDEQIYVKDLDSKFGTYVNMTTKLPANKLVSVKVGDRISLGSGNETFMITYKGGRV